MFDCSHFLAFGVGDDGFALPIERVREVLEMQPVSRMPGAPDYVLGLIDLHGEGLIVLDFRLKFGVARKPATESSRVVVVEANVDGHKAGLGLLVDRVYAVTNFDGGKLAPAPPIGERWNTDFVLGVGREAGRIYIALDLDRLLLDEPLAAQAA